MNASEELSMEDASLTADPSPSLEATGEDIVGSEDAAGSEEERVMRDKDEPEDPQDTSSKDKANSKDFFIVEFSQHILMEIIASLI
jgi:hypothetical protein